MDWRGHYTAIKNRKEYVIRKRVEAFTDSKNMYCILVMCQAFCLEEKS